MIISALQVFRLNQLSHRCFVKLENNNKFLRHYRQQPDTDFREQQVTYVFKKSNKLRKIMGKAR